jgi:LPPG:FO 2-phospho-L-lactate transferase
MDGLRAIEVDVWFNLGDRDLAIGLERARRLQNGERLTEAHRTIIQSLGVTAAVLPMSDAPVRTRVMSGGRWWPFQEYMIRAGGAVGAAPPVEDVEFRGAGAAAPTPEVLDAIATARAIVIGPSNPVISIGPILAVDGMRAALSEARAPIVAVSPLVAGEVVKGPTAGFMDFTGLPVSNDGIARYYEGLVNGLVADRRTKHLPVLETDVLMATADDRRRVAAETLGFAQALR